MVHILCYCISGGSFITNALIYVLVMKDPHICFLLRSYNDGKACHSKKYPNHIKVPIMSYKNTPAHTKEFYENP